MALNFNPFEKDKAAPTPKTKNKHSHYRVFDDPTQQSGSSNKKETQSTPLDSLSRVPDEKNTSPETDHKETTNGSQNGLQSDYKQITKDPDNGSQTGYKQATEKTKRVTQQTTEEITTRLQTDHKRATSGDISALVGHERHLLLFIFDECRVTGELVTASLTLSRIKEELKTRTGSTAKTIIARLIEKGFIVRGKAKTGRGGWMSFQLEREVFQRLLLETDYKRTTNGAQTGDKETTKRTTQRTTEAPSSSSKDLDINKLTTTGDGDTSENLSPNWAAIDTSPLLPIRFGWNHLVQLARIGKLTAEEMQDSIYAFAFDLEANGKGKEINGAALNYFMGIMRKGPYAAPANYEPPELRQRRLYLETKEREQKARKELELKFEAVEFEEWMAKVSPEEKMKVVPPTEFMKPGGAGYTSQLREYFRENIWPQSRENFLREVNSPK